MTTIQDPLGLQALESAVARLREEAIVPGDTNGTWAPLVARLDEAHAAFEARMELLRDRYAMLKRTSAQLAEEVAWLRDQLDDVIHAEAPRQTPAPRPASAKAHASETSARTDRRYTDRWKGRRP